MTRVATAVRTGSRSSSGTLGRLATFVRRHPALSLAMLVIAAILAASVLAPWVAPADPLRGSLRARNQLPGGGFLLGTDGQGRDILSRMLYGARETFMIGAIGLGLGGCLGSTLGLLAAFYSRVDAVIMRFNDVLLSFPAILVGLAVAGILGPGFTTLVFALSVAAFPQAARIARSAALVVSRKEYVESGRAIGLRDSRLIWRYVLRNSLPEIIVYLTLQFGQTILLAVSLSFLGLGIKPPLPELGSMIGDGRSSFFLAPHVALIPCAAVFLIVMCVNVIGDGLRDILDPRLRQ